ncbi:glycosyltransferase [Streptomyces sp. NPDC127051]|uniref:glycosyltransferase n=1 Tax=Streptomyces sp. NPDC127051 TaxID=3347119 RepID=UPI0036636DA8
MSRFLFVMPPLVGHINPAVGVASELVRRGHQVAWVGDIQLIRELAGQQAVIFPCTGPQLASGESMRPTSIRGPEALKFLWEKFLIPLAHATAPSIENAISEFRPDIVVADQQALAGPIISERSGIPWVTSATTSGEFTAPVTGMRKIEAWIDELLHRLCKQLGNPTGTADPRFSPYLVLAFTTEEFAGPTPRANGQTRFVGPSLAARPPTSGFPWEWLDDTRGFVLITLGTINADAGNRFLGECRQALRQRSGHLQAVIVDPAQSLGQADTSMTAGVPTDRDVLVLPRVPQLPLLARARAVICHAGHNTVCETLWHGIPLLVAPIRDDQPIVASQVTDAGAGIRLRFSRATASQIGAALDTILTEPQYRASAQRIQASFHRAGGTGTAASHLEQLAHTPEPARTRRVQAGHRNAGSTGLRPGA